MASKEFAMLIFHTVCEYIIMVFWDEYYFLYALNIKKKKYELVKRDCNTVFAARL